MDSQRDNLLLEQLNSYRATSTKLQMEAFKLDNVFNMMNNCADRCNLVYKETGIQDKEDPQVQCFNNCISKAYKLASAASLN